MSAPAPRGHEHAIPVTREGYRRLQDELRSLDAEREALAATLREARAVSDPLSENAALLDALADHERLERRIAELRSDLARARVIADPASNGEAAIGTRIRLRPLDRGGTARDYTLVSSLEADPADGRLSVESPVGDACVGRRPGEVVVVDAPRGRLRFELVAVTDDEREPEGVPEALAA